MLPSSQVGYLHPWQTHSAGELPQRPSLDRHQKRLGCEKRWELRKYIKKEKIFRLTLKDIFQSLWSACSHSEQQFGFQTKVRRKEGTKTGKNVPFLRNRSSFAKALRVILEKENMITCQENILSLLFLLRSLLPPNIDKICFFHLIRERQKSQLWNQNL